MMDSSSSGTGEGAHSAADLPAGTNIDGYVIMRRLGAGDISHVYEVTRQSDGMRAAMKVLMLVGMGSWTTTVKRFFREVRAINSIQHPNIAEILDVGRLLDGRPFYVMELIEGMTLSKLVRTHGRLSLDRCMTIVERVCAALMTAHKAGIVHRDIKPGNILVGNSDDTYVKLIDFGVAKLLHYDEPGQGLTAAGQHLGTPTSMSPEQVRCEVVDQRADIYSLGVLTFYLLTGTYPFGRGTLAELKQHILKSPPPRLSDFAPVSPMINDVVHKCLEKDSTRRYDSVEAFLTALRDAIERSSAKERDEATLRQALGIYVEAYTDDDDADDEVLDDMESIIEAAVERLGGAGFTPVLETDSTALFVLLLDGGRALEQQADALAAAEDLYEALAGRDDPAPGVKVSIVLHVDDAAVAPGGERIVSGPIAGQAWVPQPLAEGVSMTKRLLHRLDT